MGFYGDRVLPRVIDKVCGAKSSEPLRQRVCAAAHGDVVELGFGSGLNVPHYPRAVTRLEAVEPNDVAWKLSARAAPGVRARCPPHRTRCPTAPLRRQPL